MEISGMAHVIITAGDFEKSTAFYRGLLPAMGLGIIQAMLKALQERVKSLALDS